MGPQPEALPHLSLQSKQNNVKNQLLSVLFWIVVPSTYPTKTLLVPPLGVVTIYRSKNRSLSLIHLVPFFFFAKISTKDDGPTIRWRPMGASWRNTLVKLVHWLEEDMLLTSERKIASHMHGRIVIKDGFHTIKGNMWWQSVLVVNWWYYLTIIDFTEVLIYIISKIREFIMLESFSHFKLLR